MSRWFLVEDNEDGTCTCTDSKGQTLVFAGRIEKVGLCYIGTGEQVLRAVQSATLIPDGPTP